MSDSSSKLSPWTIIGICGVSAALAGAGTVWAYHWDYGVFLVAWAAVLAIILLARPDIRRSGNGASVVGFLLIGAVVGSAVVSHEITREDQAFRSSLPAYTDYVLRSSGSSARTIDHDYTRLRSDGQTTALVRMDWTVPRPADALWRPRIRLWFTDDSQATSDVADVSVDGAFSYDEFGTAMPTLRVSIRRTGEAYTFDAGLGYEEFQDGSVQVPVTLPAGEYRVVIRGNCLWSAEVAPILSPTFGVWYNGAYVEF